MKITFENRVKFSNDGKSVTVASKGQVHEVSDDMAKVFVERKEAKPFNPVKETKAKVKQA